MTVKTVRELTNVEIVLLAVSDLGGEVKALDIEDVAIRAYEYAPEKFCWRKFKDRIDLRVIAYAIKDASTPKKGPPLLIGSYRHGFMLSPDGNNWVAQFRNTYDLLLDNSFRNKSISEKIYLEQTRLLSSSAYLKFVSNRSPEITEIDFMEFSRINEYFPSHARERRFGVIDNTVKGNEELEACWSFIKSKFMNKGEKNA